MIAAIRLFAMAFIILTVVFVFLSVRNRWRARRRLEAEFDSGQDIGETDRDTYIQEGLKDYEGSLRRKLIFAVYIVPLFIVATMIYVTNFM